MKTTGEILKWSMNQKQYFITVKFPEYDHRDGIMQENISVLRTQWLKHLLTKCYGTVTYPQMVQHAHTHYMRTPYVERKKERGEGREEGKGRERRRKAKQRMTTTSKSRLRVYECTILTDFVTIVSLLPLYHLCFQTHKETPSLLSSLFSQSPLLPNANIGFLYF